MHDLRRFLHNHYLAGHEVDLVYNMFLAQALNSPKFLDECSDCHGTAAEFLRDSLVFRGGLLYSRIDGRSLPTALSRHGNLQADHIDFYTKLLTPVAHDIYQPPSQANSLSAWWNAPVPSHYQ